MESHEYYMDQALALAREALDQGEVPVGCVIAGPDGSVIGTGRNRRALVAEEDMMAQRIKDGWSIPQMGKARVVIKPGDNEIERLLSMPNTKQVFSGIDAFPLVYRVFKMAVKKRLDISVMMEPYQWQGFKGFIRRGKYALHALRYAKHINHIFATGELGVHAFLKIGRAHV